MSVLLGAAGGEVLVVDQLGFFELLEEGMANVNCGWVGELGFRPRLRSLAS